MNYYTKSQLIESLESRINYIVLKNNKSTAVISEHGGRVLGVYPDEEVINLLWVNPALKEIDLEEEWNIGGDRYWISPERLFFYKNPEAWQEWFCPSELDPAYYKIEMQSLTSCTLTTEVFLTNQLIKDVYKGFISRHISIIEEPIQTGVNYCGIQYLDECTLMTPNLKVNGWSLAQVISGSTENPGTVVIPTKQNPKPQSYFRIIPNDRIIIAENYIAFKIDVNDIYKLAIRPEDINFKLPGKIGYVLKIPNSEEYGFLLKISSDIPKTQKQCFDTSRDHPNAEIGVIQSYNAESPSENNLMFGEIELQLNPFEPVYHTSQGFARHQLFGYVGSKEEIVSVVEKYLGIKDPTLF
jgi:hypothetical protein